MNMDRTPASAILLVSHAQRTRVVCAQCTSYTSDGMMKNRSSDTSVRCSVGLLPETWLLRDGEEGREAAAEPEETRRDERRVELTWKNETIFIQMMVLHNIVRIPLPSARAKCTTAYAGRIMIAATKTTSR